MTVFALIEGTVLLLLAAALLAHVASRVADGLGDWLGRCAERDQSPPVLKALPNFVSDLASDEGSAESGELVTALTTVAHRPWNTSFIKAFASPRQTSARDVRASARMANTARPDCEYAEVHH